MDEMVTRIIEIERQCAAAVTKAEQEAAERIAKHKLALEEQKETLRNQILSDEHSRRIRAVSEAKGKAENASTIATSVRKKNFQDPVLKQAIQNDILSLLLEA